MAVTCLVCGEETESFNNGGVEAQKFVTIVIRYLSLNPDEFSSTLINLPIKVQNTLINKVKPRNRKSELPNICGSCLPIVRKFMDTYESWSSIQLQLNWRLTEIVELMKNLDHNGENIVPGTGVEEWTELREKICAKVETISKKEFPRLIITKVPDTETIIKPECLDLDFDENSETGTALTDPDYDPAQEDAAEFEGDGDDNYIIIKEENPARFQNHSDEVQPTPKENGYTCRICKTGTEFRHYDEFRLHLKSHRVKKPHLCHTCGKSFAKNSNLISHSRRHTGEKPFKCKFCPKSFAYDTVLIVHERIHQNERLFKCSVCSKGFNDRNSCKRHLRQVHGVEPAKVAENIMRAKSSITTIPKPLKCSFSSCERRFINKQSRRRHERTHRGPEPFHCKICALGFPRYFELLEHQRSHGITESQKNYECGVCKKRFPRPIRCRLHLEKFHKKIKDIESMIIRHDQTYRVIDSTLDPAPMAETMGKLTVIETRSPPVENNHEDENDDDESQETNQATSNVVYRYVCEICGPETRFQYFDEFKRHKRIHRERRPFLCGKCGKSFARNAGLVAHELTHSGDKPYKCQFCGKDFGQNSSLRVHEEIHINERPYSCSVCNKAFNSRACCRRHLREVHQMEASEACKNVVKTSESTSTSESKVGKPLQCRQEGCDKRFINHQSRSRHERKHKGDKPYQCRFCQMGFSSYFQFRDHEKIHRLNLNGKMLTCGVCGKMFARKIRCKNHLQKDHHLLDDDEINKMIVRIFAK